MKKSFTLIEILVVITVIGLLLSVAAVTYSTVNRNARDAKRKADLENIRAAVEMYRSNDTSSQYPVAVNCGVLDPLVEPYLPPFPQDPKSPTYTYGCISSASDYTIGAHLEGSTSTCTSISSCTGGCNYCVGPYGQKP